ncbi:hypothetical protein H5410_035318 [Solanum commersonii]|uniref:Uncharacterized protein n=1 Tax=Solanum commersonii TaxID=4109 RepID=A0A9J5Y4S1_SOLCO|nr:hypothetical protein H5410_035318 [Solanum commersonii]
MCIWCEHCCCLKPFHTDFFHKDKTQRGCTSMVKDGTIILTELDPGLYRGRNVTIVAPTIVAHFTNVDLELSPSRTFAQVEEGLVCRIYCLQMKLLYLETWHRKFPNWI